MGTASYYVYILASRLGGTLYIGVTNNLLGRVYQHKTGTVEGFTKRYKVDRLVYFELVENIEAVIRREKQMKRWNRAWKVELIERQNPSWVDLYDQLARTGSPLSRE